MGIATLSVAVPEVVVAIEITVVVSPLGTGPPLLGVLRSELAVSELKTAIALVETTDEDPPIGGPGAKE